MASKTLSLWMQEFKDNWTNLQDLFSLGQKFVNALNEDDKRGSSEYGQQFVDACNKRKDLDNDDLVTFRDLCHSLDDLLPVWNEQKKRDDTKNMRLLEGQFLDSYHEHPCPNRDRECTHTAKYLPGSLCQLQPVNDRFCNCENNGLGFEGDVTKRWAEFLTKTMTTLNEFVKSHPENPQKLRRFLKGFLWTQKDRCVFTIDELNKSFLRGDYQNTEIDNIDEY